MKFAGETGYNKESHPILSDENLSDENLQIVVKTIFRKAQTEKQYCVFYGDLCEKIIRLELQLRNLSSTKKYIKHSMFRRQLLVYCKESFEQFFNQDTINLLQSKDEEKILNFKTRLLGNIMFVGELFRRKLLQESIILSVFDMLLGVDTQET